MMPQPLGDKIIARPVGDQGKVGTLFIPPNQRQGLGTHHKAVILAAGPKALGKDGKVVPSGTIIHVSERWGERFIYDGKDLYSGRLRDINFILDGEALADTNTYTD